jgi:heme-degrading monooxygenase HmoA
MIVRVSSAIVSETQVGIYLEYAESSVMPAYETAEGLIWVFLSRRQVVGYVEFLIISIWQSGEAWKRFLEGQPATTGIRSDGGAIYVEPRAYELVVSREGRFRPTGTPRA